MMNDGPKKPNGENPPSVAAKKVQWLGIDQITVLASGKAHEQESQLHSIFPPQIQFLTTLVPSSVLALEG